MFDSPGGLCNFNRLAPKGDGLRRAAPQGFALLGAGSSWENVSGEFAVYHGRRGGGSIIILTMRSLEICRRASNFDDEPRYLLATTKRQEEPKLPSRRSC